MTGLAVCVPSDMCVLAVVNWSITGTSAMCLLILEVRVSLLGMKTKWCVERRMLWPDENKMMQKQGRYEGQINENK